jgi:hypothetical protein
MRVSSDHACQAEGMFSCHCSHVYHVITSLPYSLTKGCPHLNVTLRLCVEWQLFTGIPGEYRLLAIPVPIPNTVVKQDPPMIVLRRESRLPPGFN